MREKKEGGGAPYQKTPFRSSTAGEVQEGTKMKHDPCRRDRTGLSVRGAVCGVRGTGYGERGAGSGVREKVEGQVWVCRCMASAGASAGA